MQDANILDELSDLSREGVHAKTIAAARVILGGLDTSGFWGFRFAAFARRLNSHLCSRLPDPARCHLNLTPGFNALRELRNYQVDHITDPVRSVTQECAMGMSQRLVVLGLVGEPGSGRNTLATHLVDGHGFSKMSFDDPLRVAASLLYNIPMHYFSDEQLRTAELPALRMSPLRCMEVIGGDVCQGLRRSIWSDRLLLRMSALGRLSVDDAPRVVVSGLRYEDEASFVRALPNGRVVWVSRELAGRRSVFNGSARPGDLQVANAGNTRSFLASAVTALGLPVLGADAVTPVAGAAVEPSSSVLSAPRHTPAPARP